MALAHAPQQKLEPLLRPATPPTHKVLTYGYRRNSERQWEITDYGLDLAAITQRAVLSYALGYESRGQLAQRYAVSERQLQSWISGDGARWMTLPIRERLQANGISLRRGNRTAQVRAALERLGARAADMLIFPHNYCAEDREQVADDLYLLSGAWREDGQP